MSASSAIRIPAEGCSSGSGGMTAYRPGVADLRTVDRQLERRGLVHVQHVTDPLEGGDRAWLPGQRPELATHPTDPDAEVLEVVPVFRPPHLGEELGVQDHLSGVGC